MSRLSEPHRFVGTKVVNGTPMSRGDYNAYRGWALPEDEDGEDEGYLVEYLDGGKPNHPKHAGYISWSPKEQFDNAHRSVTGMSFGQALELLKIGQRVARAGWNGKGMWIALSPGSLALPAERFWAHQNRKHAEEHGPTDVLPCITMKTADDSILMGWLASQTDMLADDWCVA
jgi:hypothetical protein